jgi:hypothetical protein
MSASLVQVTIVLAQGASVLTSTGAAYAGTQVIVTDSSGTPQPTVTLTGKESPPWTLVTSVAPGAGTVVANDVDVNGTVLNSVSQGFTEAGSPPTFAPTSGITVTPTAAAASLAARLAAARK